ncbi:ABC transporter substrate-binding protein [Rhizomonospora bruguierae]|uniref:ABC transporter substrate-binding protein n=1 Tax=Rhizomonospora bruguierae TaxID=1581705 RepID=UPI001BCD3063|nr:ABC transporter substrate-binding protein [Micromonospora sp. NBRC 107566]
MKGKKRILMAAALAAVTILGSGCGGGDGSGETDGDGLGTIKVAIGTRQTFEFLPAEYGLKLGVWEKRGLKAENLYVQGSGQVSQAMAAHQADLGLTAGASGVDAILKGVPSKIVGLIGRDFKMMLIVVPNDSPITDISGLRGKTLGVTSAGSLTDYLAKSVALKQGWPENAIKRANIGGLTEQLAALESGAIDAFVWSAEAGFTLEEQGKGRVLADFGNIVQNSVFEDIVANDSAIEGRPDAIRAYLEGWYETVRYMEEHRDETIAFMVEEFELPQTVAAKTYDHDIANLSLDGTIPQQNLEGLAKSVVDQGIVDKQPSIETFWDSQFVPVTVE